MANFAKDELLSKAAPYFSQGENVMFATEDGNFFYENHKSYAINHSKTKKIECFKLLKSDFDAISKTEKAVKTSKGSKSEKQTDIVTSESTENI